MIKNLLISKLLVLLLLSISFAQGGGNNPPKKIAFVNELAFDNDKTGIKKLYDAYQQMGMIDCFPSPCSKETYEKREKILLQPVLKEISDSLKQIEIQFNIVILQVFQLESDGQLLVLDKKLDISEQFIKFFNKNAEKFDETLVLNIPESKIGIINTELFFDKEKGIKRLISLDNTNPEKRCAGTDACVEVGKFIQSYAANKGFSLIFDSSKNLPKEIKEFKIQDITQNFIFEYNKNNL